MRRRLPLVLSALAVAISLTGVGAADAVRAVRRALFAQNAGAVNGIKASRTPRPGRLLALDQAGHLPASVFSPSMRGPRGPQGPPGPVATITNPYVFRAHAVAAQDTPAPGSIRVLLGGEDFDPHGDFDAGSSTYVAPVDGTYLLMGAVALSSAATGRVFAQLTSSRAGMRIRGDDDSATPYHVAVVTGLMRLRRGDTVELDLYTAQANTIIATEALTQFSGALLAADG
ncbi:MAG: hypothetical protein JSS99_10600 [Actinobacteria bacterium]|nr:hypothetical protein [Actinomycetota bacterium]